jgi:hypothetical protein
MAEGHSKYGENVERISVDYSPHERYITVNEHTGENIHPGIPILSSVTGGQVIKKDITYYTIKCPACLVPAKYDEENEPICPQCGIICSGKDGVRSEQIVRDAKAAGRINDGGNQ